MSPTALAHEGSRRDGTDGEHGSADGGHNGDDEEDSHGFDVALPKILLGKIDADDDGSTIVPTVGASF